MNKIADSFHYDAASKKLTLKGASNFTCDRLFELTQGGPILSLQIDGGSCNRLPGDFCRINPRAVFFNRLPFSYVPGVLAECKDLAQISFKFCETKEIPEDALPLSTHWLILTGNRNLKALPKSMGKLEKLRKCGLVGCAISDLPAEMENCQELELFRIAANNFSLKPLEWVFTLPRLAWYGDASNPFSAGVRPSLMHDIEWSHVRFEMVGGKIKELGHSPSSQVFKGTLDDDRHVAVKLYANDLTSDGFPRADRDACVAAQGHPNIVKIIGNLKNSPEGKEGLIFSHITQDYQPLGSSPNAQTVTRDAFHPDVTFSLSRAVTIFKDIASACQHIHAKGIAHGDLYAHNISSTKDGLSILGDFGAASFYLPAEKSMREGHDILAFGHLMEDVLVRLCPQDKMGCSDVTKSLWDAHRLCTDRDIFVRPSFKDMCTLLETVTPARELLPF